MYSRNYQRSGERRRQSAPIGYGNAEELRSSLLVPPEYRGEFLRRPHMPPADEGAYGDTEAVPREDEADTKRTFRGQAQNTGAAPFAGKRAVFMHRNSDPSAPQVSSADAIDEKNIETEVADEAENTEAPRKMSAGGLLSELSSLLFGRGGEEDALLILGVGLLLMNSRMERGKTPLFSGGHLHPEEDDIGLFLILLLLFS